MKINLLLQGVLMGLVVAVPVGPLGLLSISRALSMGAWYGLFSGLGIATADAFVAGAAALGISLISDFLTDHQFALRFIGGIFLCYLGLKIYRTQAIREPSGASTANGLLGAYVSTFLLTCSNPVTILAFVAIYAAWNIQSLSGHYAGAALLSIGVFTGSAAWWVALFVGLTGFRDRFNLRVLWWIHRISGAGIAAFGVVILVSLTRLGSMWGIL